MENSPSEYRTLYHAKFQKWVTTSTSHGLPNIFQTKNPIVRLIWTLAVLGSCGYCVSTIVTSVQDFLKYKTTLSSQIVQDIPATFPAITICNLSPYNYYYASSYLVVIGNALYKPECLDYLKTYISCAEGTTTDNNLCVEALNSINSHCVEALNYDPVQFKNFIAEKVTDDIIRKSSLGFDFIDEMKLECKFNMDNCQRGDTTVFWDNMYGNCFTYNGVGNSSKVWKTNQSGSKMGFSVQLILNSYTFDYDLSYTNGLYLVVHNQSTLPFALNNGITLPPGFEINIVIDRVFTSKLGQPYSNCIDELVSDDPYRQKLFGLFKDLNIPYYDQKMCLKLCSQDKLIDTCGCMDVTTPRIRNASYCYTNSDLDCMRIQYPQSINQIFQDYCIPACPEKCSTVDYKLQLNYALYPSWSYLQDFSAIYGKPLPADPVELEKFGREGIISLNVYYENLQYTVVEETPLVTTETLLGNVGGQLGLFIGISFLSFIEIIEVAIEFLNIFYKQKKEQYSTRRRTRMATIDRNNKIRPVEELKKDEENRPTVFTVSN